MKVSKACIELIKEFERFMPKPYLCPAGVPTIGYGSTMYPNGKKVTMKDPPISEPEGMKILLWHLSLFEKDVTFLTRSISLVQLRFDALVDFAYNIGSDIDADDIAEGLGDSTLLKMILKNQNDPAIAKEWAKWDKANGKVLPGLTRRRKKEIDMWFLK